MYRRNLQNHNKDKLVFINNMVNDDFTNFNWYKIHSQPKIPIGYWRSNPLNVFDKLPWPTISWKTLFQAKVIEQAKLVLEKYGWKEHYFGQAHCRLCWKLNGNAEYLINYQGITWVIPTGYFHYLETHNVKIDEKLVEITDYYMNL